MTKISHQNELKLEVNSLEVNGDVITGSKTAKYLSVVIKLTLIGGYG